MTTTTTTATTTKSISRACARACAQNGAACLDKGPNTIHICAPNGVFINGVELDPVRACVRGCASVRMLASHPR